MKKIFLTLAATLATVLSASAQDNPYVWPEDPAVLEKLDRWQDLKFGVILHWGLYSVPGIVESWNLCNEDWVVRPQGSTYEGYKQWYFGLAKDFNPVDFDPSQWASVFRRAGMKYLIFTTKHHDGFCLYDSQYTDFSLAKAGPFSNDPRRDATRFVFDAFRAEDFMIGAYYSKPDWHYPGFWNPYYATPDRNPNYRRELHPDWWQSYVDYTQNQLREITGGRYGQLDILWLDGGWIDGEEVGLSSLVPGFRQANPGLIVVDRAIGGPNENYTTPERGVPEGQLDHPWESCIPLSSDWGFVPGASYMSVRYIIGLLAEICAKGGCFVLGIGPTPEGLIEDRVVALMEELGEWMDRCGSAIYETRITPEYHAVQEGGDLWFTQSKDATRHYAVYALRDANPLPATLSWTGNIPAGKVTLLNNGKRLKVKVKGDTVTVTLPKGLREEPLAFRW